MWDLDSHLDSQQQPPGFLAPNDSRLVCKTQWSLYAFKQPPWTLSSTSNPLLASAFTLFLLMALSSRVMMSLEFDNSKITLS